MEKVLLGERPDGELKRRGKKKTGRKSGDGGRPCKFSAGVVPSVYSLIYLLLQLFKRHPRVGTAFLFPNGRSEREMEGIILERDRGRPPDDREMESAILEQDH